MASKFVPFLATTAANRGATTQAGPAGAQSATEFKPFVSSSGPHGGSKAVEVGIPAAALCQPAEGAPAKVTVQRDGERITQIRIECRCGEVIELACAY